MYSMVGSSDAAKNDLTVHDPTINVKLIVSETTVGLP